MNIFKKIFVRAPLAVAKTVAKVPTNLGKGVNDAIHVAKAVNAFENVKEDINTMDTKSLFKSKTFWTNLVGLALQVGGILPAKYGMPVLAVANLILRLLTDQPVHIFGK